MYFDFSMLRPDHHCPVALGSFTVTSNKCYLVTGWRWRGSIFQPVPETASRVLLCTEVRPAVECCFLFLSLEHGVKWRAFIFLYWVSDLHRMWTGHWKLVLSGKVHITVVLPRYRRPDVFKYISHCLTLCHYLSCISHCCPGVMFSPTVWKVSARHSVNVLYSSNKRVPYCSCCSVVRDAFVSTANLFSLCGVLLIVSVGGILNGHRNTFW